MQILPEIEDPGTAWPLLPLYRGRTSSYPPPQPGTNKNDINDNDYDENNTYTNTSTKKK